MEPGQQEKLELLRSITASNNGDQDTRVLESVGWDVQKAVDVLFGDDSAPARTQVPTSAAATSTSSSNNATGRGIEQMEVDDAPAPRAPRHTYGGGASSIIMSTLAVPIAFTFNLLAYILRFLRIPFPRFTVRPFHLNWNPNINAFTSLWRPTRRENPGVVAERWVQGLEEEVGAMTWAHARAAEEGERPEKEIPDFYLGSYNDALNATRRELKILCVILLSDEHDDVPRFKRETLTDPAFNKILKDEGMLIWGGEIREIEAYSAGLKLGATTYPFVAFISLQPARIPNSNGSSTSTRDILAVLSRNAGATNTTPQVLAQHLEGRLLPRVRPVLERYRIEERSRVQDRIDRENSERRALEAQMRDSDRIRQMREEKEREQRAEIEAQRLQVERQNAAEMKKRKLKARQAFWATAASSRVTSPPSSEVIRITVRLPNGGRSVQQFAPSESITSLYAFAASKLITSPPLETYDAAHDDYDVDQDGWGFALATTYPRVPIPWMPSTPSGGGGATIADVSGGALKGGAVVVVEMSADAGMSSHAGLKEGTASTGGDGDDEYLSEED